MQREEIRQLKKKTGLEIPSFICLNHNLLPNEKLLYGLIHTFEEELGCCYSTNATFAEMLNTGRQSIIRHLNKLKEFKYIDVKYVTLPDNSVQRRITCKNNETHKGAKQWHRNKLINVKK